MAKPALGVFLATMLIGLLLAAWLGFSKPMQGDPLQYLVIGQSVAAGECYCNPVGPWPEAPAVDRMPFWPLMIAAGIQLLPFLEPETVSRICGIFCMAVSGAAIAVLCLRINVRPWLAVVAGFGVSLSPAMLVMSLEGFSEPPFVMLVALGLVLIHGGQREHYWGAVCFGLAMLVRSNFVAVLPIVFAIGCLTRASRSNLRSLLGWKRALILVILATVPLSLWLVRNAAVTGRFPLISSLEGETLYGANNPVVAHDLEYWGYWVIPDKVPGETPKLALARNMNSELILGDYYLHKGRTWIRDHWMEMPRLIVGKLVRAFVPVPWKPVFESYVVFSYRLLLDVLLLVFTLYWWRKTPKVYLIMMFAFLIVLLVTTVVFYGTFRFTHATLELFYIPMIAIGAEQWLRQRYPCTDSAARWKPGTA